MASSIQEACSFASSRASLVAPDGQSFSDLLYFEGTFWGIW